MRNRFRFKQKRKRLKSGEVHKCGVDAFSRMTIRSVSDTSIRVEILGKIVAWLQQHSPRLKLAASFPFLHSCPLSAFPRFQHRALSPKQGALPTPPPPPLLPMPFWSDKCSAATDLNAREYEVKLQALTGAPAWTLRSALCGVLLFEPRNCTRNVPLMTYCCTLALCISLVPCHVAANQ